MTDTTISWDEQTIHAQFLRLVPTNTAPLNASAHHQHMTLDGYQLDIAGDDTQIDTPNGTLIITTPHQTITATRWTLASRSAGQITINLIAATGTPR